MNGIKPRKKYDREFKQETVRLVTEVGRSASEVAKELGINVNVIYCWVRQYKADRENFFPSKGHQKPDDAELHRLRK
jgi:transposase